MSLLVLALLVGLWAAILLPGAVRAHRSSSPTSTVDAFRRTMERLSTRSDEAPFHDAWQAADAARGGGPEAASFGRLDARRRALVRRRTVVAILVGGLIAGGMGAVWGGAGFLWLLAIDAVALAAYLGLLLGMRARAEEASRKVLPLPARPPSPPPPASTDAVSLPSAAGEHG